MARKRKYFKAYQRLYNLDFMARGRELDIGYPPDQLDTNEVISKVLANRGSSFEVEIAPSHIGRASLILEYGEKPETTLLVALSPALRNKYFIRRGGLVLVALEERGKIKGEIKNLIADTREWQKMPWWPSEYIETRDTTTLDLPPSDSDYEDEV